MTARLRRAVLLAAVALSLVPTVARTQPLELDSIQDVVERLQACWEPPARANPRVVVSVVVAFRRDGSILGRPKITYESRQASDDDRLLYRFAIIKSLERCTPLAFSEGLGGAIAGRPFVLRFGGRNPNPPTKERTAWLIPTTP